MLKLHQLEVFGKRLVVEYANSAQQHHMLEADKDKLVVCIVQAMGPGEGGGVSAS